MISAVLRKPWQILGCYKGVPVAKHVREYCPWTVEVVPSGHANEKSDDVLIGEWNNAMNQTVAWHPMLPNGVSSLQKVKK